MQMAIFVDAHTEMKVGIPLSSIDFVREEKDDVLIVLLSGKEVAVKCSFSGAIDIIYSAKGGRRPSNEP